MVMKQVLCTYCNAHLYDYSGPEDKVSFKADHFTPASDGYPRPRRGDELKCPECGIRFVAFSNQIDGLLMLAEWPFEGTGMQDWKR
ncbi:MAG: hypothetical protein HY650_03865 [Acidobacteria bacterium]|nr:hypothetical protein [Acidobacteriota bacterium]